MTQGLDLAFSIAIMAGVTFFTRAFPFIFFSRRKVPPLLQFAESYIPPMIMVILVIYCLKDIHWTTAPHGLPEIISSILVAALHLWKRNPLLSIFGGTIFYMILVQGVFIH